MRLGLNCIIIIILSLSISCKKNSGLEPTPVSLESGNTNSPVTLSNHDRSLNGSYGILSNDQRFESTDIIEIQKGVLLAILSNSFESPDKGSIFKCYSYDNGVTWTSPENINLPNSGYKFTACNLFKVNKRIFLVMNRVAKSAATSEGGIPAVCFSDDAGMTWNKPTRMLKGQEREIVLMNSRNITVTKAGRIIIPIGHGQFGKNSYQISLMYSNDNGVTWNDGGNCFGSINTKKAHFAEPSIGQLNDGRLIMLIRTNLGYIYRSYSSDNGTTWEFPQRTSLVSPWTAHSIRITKQGYIIAAYTNCVPRTDPGYPRSNLKFAVSYDNGATWKPSGTIKEVPESESEFLMEPNITFTSNNKILVTYYHLLSPKNHRIETAIFDRSDVLRDEENWANLQWWSTSGEGIVSTANSQLHLSDHSNTITGVLKNQIISSSYIFEFRGKVNAFVGPGNIDNYSTLGLKIEGGSYKLMFKVESDGFYVSDYTGTWIRHYTSGYLSNKYDWHIWRFEVLSGKATLYMDGTKVIDKYNLQKSYDVSGIISHWTSSNFDMKTDCYVDYSYYDPL